MSMQAISIQNLTKYYKDFRALNNVSIEVASGEFFGFLGPNGAGKTTAISVLTGLANFKEGQVHVFGKDVQADYRETRAMIGLVPQEFNFDPFFSAQEILELVGGYFNLTKSKARERSEALLKQFNLWDKRHLGYKKLSGGMKRRLLIARALVHEPKILILDEPTAGVDLELRYQLWDFLKMINEEGTTILLTTHYIEEAERLCNRIGVIHQGEIVAVESKAELIRQMGGQSVELYIKKSQVDSGSLEFPDGLGVCVEESGAKLKFDNNEMALTTVLKILHEKSVGVESINVLRPTLEDVFLKLIKEHR